MNCKHFCLLILSLTILLTVSSCMSCSDSKKDRGEGHKINPMVEQLDETPDEAMLVRLDRVDGENIHVTDIESHEVSSFRYIDAQGNGKIKGSLTVGDTLSIFPHHQSQTVEICINTSEMSGRWFYDMQQHRGFRFEHLGALSSINADEVSFREWKLLNGKLYIYFVDMQQVAGDRHEFQVEQAEIISLSRNELVLQFHGRTLQCKRQVGVLKF